MVELVDSVDLGAVTSGKVFHPAVIANQSADWCGNPFSKNRLACFYKCGLSELLHLGFLSVQKSEAQKNMRACWNR